MRALLTLVIGLTACTFEHGVPVGGDDDGDMGSGSGSGDPDKDSDGDGLFDLTDNCPNVGNADQRDHDDDSRGDSCDGCPHIVDSGNDIDLDGVGDACDPRPTEPGDRMAFFEGFYEAPQWKSVIGANTWLSTNGALSQHGTDTAYQLVRDDTPNLAQVFVDARVRINALANNTSTRRSTGVVLSYRDPNHYIFCGLAAPANLVEVNAGQVSTDFFGTAKYDYAPGTFPGQMSGEWLTLKARTTTTEDGDTHIDCASHRSGVSGTASFIGDADINGDIGIRTNGADASFDYVFVVAIPASSS
jgi:hypothetical protein